MPYNTTAIPPRKEPTGQTQLPLSRVKKIVGQDADIAVCSTNAAFVITCAAEMFIQHLTNAAHTQAKLERKPRRNIQYKDVASAVSHEDALEFLSDIVPKTTTMRKIRQRQVGAKTHGRADKGGSRRPLSPSAVLRKSNGAVQQGEEEPTVNGKERVFELNPWADDRVNGPDAQLELEMRQAVSAGSTQRDEDVPMSG